VGQLEDLTEKIIEIQQARDWKQFHAPKNIAIALVAEAAELVAHYRFEDDPPVSEKLADEAGDVFYNFLLYCHEAGIDPEAAIKHTFAKIDLKYPVNKAHGRPEKYDRLAE
jgi:NTP pyrophosphatase (non-canonical NTP hydrolase)